MILENFRLNTHKKERDEGPRQKAGLRFVAMQLEQLAGDWAKLANYSSRFNYYPASLVEEDIMAIAEQLSAAADRANSLIETSYDVLSPIEVEEAERLMNLALYAEHSIQPVRKTEFFKSFLLQEDLSEKSFSETSEDRFIKELREISGGEDL